MDRETRTAWLIGAGFLVLWVVYAYLSPGTYDDDDVTHFFVARESLANPSLLISLWGRPLFTALYAIPAQLGYGAVEVTTAVVMSVTLVLTWHLARRLELRPAWAAIVFTAWQPILFKLGFSSLVEPIGALTLTAALLAFLGRRDRTAALLAGLLPLTRFELIVLAPFILLPVWRRRPITILLSAIPLLVWNVGGWLAAGDPIWLVDQLLHNEFGRSFEGAQPLDHYLRALPFVTGGALIVPFLLGFVAPWRTGVRGRDAVRGMVVTFVVVLSLLAWRAHGIGGSVGYLRHVVSVGPLIGLVALMGVARWRSVTARDVASWVALVLGVGLAVAACALSWHHGVYEHPVRRTLDVLGVTLHVEPWLTGVAAVGVAGLLVAARTRTWLPLGVAAIAAAATLVAEGPIPLDVERNGVREIVSFVRANAHGDRVAVNHPWFFFLSGARRTDTLHYPRVTHETLEDLEPGSLVVWENHYSSRLAGDVQIEYFAEHPDRYVPRAKGMYERTTPEGRVTSRFIYVIFEVVRPDDPRLPGAR